jgi:hypothetical protein
MENTKKAPAETLEDVNDLPTGKDELNLAEFPIALLTEKAPKGVKTLEFKDQIFDNGKRKLLNRRLTIEGSETYGLPTAKDDEVILALIQLSKRKRFHDKTLHFTRFELITLLGWSNTGQSYARIVLALRRWVSVTLHYENAWWDKSEERWTSGAFHIIDDFELNDSRETTAQMSLLASRISWSNRVFGSFVEGHLKNIRYDVYVKLRSAISKRMYRFLDKRFHHSKSCSFDLRDFAHEHIGLSRAYRDCGKLKEKLAIGIRELEDIGFLEPLTNEQRYQQESRGRWKVTFKRGNTKPKPITSAAIEPPLAAADPPTLVAELVARGVTASSAQELVRDHAAAKITAQIECLDWQVEKKPEKIADPAGYLVQAIKNDYAAPKGFVSKAERQQQKDARLARERETAEASRRKHEQKASEAAERQAISDYWNALSPTQQAEIDAASLASADPKTLAMETGPLKSMGQTIRRHEHIQKLLNGQKEPPALSESSRKRPQAPLREDV